jgi:GAF domain-containing protein
MTNKPTEEELTRVLSGNLPLKEKLMAITRLTGLHLQVDRCFLYVRNPEAGKGRIEFCWCAHKDVEDVTQHVWQYDLDLPEQDPLFGAAISLQPSVYVEDVLTAPKEVLNQEFEENTFGHRALIHAHIHMDNQLWGILQPAVWNTPRNWNSEDHDFIEALLIELGPLVKEYATELDIS